MGIAFWIIPRFRSGSPRGPVGLVWLSYALLNAGILIIILQFWFARETLIRQWRLFLAGVMIPFLWLSFADRLAIGDGIWDISLDRSLGIFILGLPLEEAVFFLITNILIVQGLLALSSPEAWARVRRMGQRVRSWIPR